MSLDYRNCFLSFNQQLTRRPNRTLIIFAAEHLFAGKVLPRRQDFHVENDLRTTFASSRVASMSCLFFISTRNIINLKRNLSTRKSIQMLQSN